MRPGKLHPCISDYWRSSVSHLCVLGLDSTTAHLTVVFNASDRCSGNSSLNDELLKGSKLQTDIFSAFSVLVSIVLFFQLTSGRGIDKLG